MAVRLVLIQKVAGSSPAEPVFNSYRDRDMDSLNKPQGFRKKTVHAECNNGKWEFEFKGLSPSDIETVRKEILEAYNKKKQL